jgi:hypothetical protein
MGEPILFHGSKFLGVSKNKKEVDEQLHVQLSPGTIPCNASIRNLTYANFLKYLSLELLTYQVGMI